jgi:hypothetical protein
MRSAGEGSRARHTPADTQSARAQSLAQIGHPNQSNRISPVGGCLNAHPWSETGHRTNVPIAVGGGENLLLSTDLTGRVGLPCAAASISVREAVRGDDAAIPATGILDRAGLGLVVDVHYAETLGVTVGPFEIVH